MPLSCGSCAIRISSGTKLFFEVFYNPGKFSLCEEVFGWLLADSVCCRSFLQALEFSNLGEESFDHRQDVLSGREL